MLLELPKAVCIMIAPTLDTECFVLAKFLAATPFIFGMAGPHSVMCHLCELVRETAKRRPQVASAYLRQTALILRWIKRGW